MKAPKHLSHKPIISVDGYDTSDGIYAGRSDAKALSIGLAQYAEDYTDFSAKVWRHTGERWSRQSEELPLHRVFDLSILIVDAFLALEKKQSPPNYDSAIIKIGDSVGIEDVKKAQTEDLKGLKAFFEKHKKEIFLPRLKELRDVIDALIS